MFKKIIYASLVVVSLVTIIGLKGNIGKSEVPRDNQISNGAQANNKDSLTNEEELIIEDASGHQFNGAAGDNEDLDVFE
ncbi:hypothetical protein [Vagococcus salmoninarum]|uniref:hypothetical protein n=1 Tax=Vagococcus salmoninarum TaxID=2739 RepID=UPI0018811FC7|nr:hypothetical protein [Vagococcus salmoninarum]MBE9388135.1 hypothetical protein [Vagococcus salmoninarum]